ncbi:MAG: hypothetical protein WBA57_06465 [Elainellaceae cyanobacterium]
MLFSPLKRVNQALKPLPQEIVKPVRKRELWVGLIGTLLVLLLCNGLADLFLNYLNSNRGYFLVSLKWNLLMQQSRPVDWLIVGDSSCNQGVDPDVLMDELGGQALNLCTVGSMLTIDDVWMLEQHINQVGPPRNLVIVHVYDIWHRDVEEETLAHLAQIPLSNDELDKFSLPLSLEPEDRLELFLHRSIPLYSANKSLEEWIREPVESFRESREFIVTDRGFMPRKEINQSLFSQDVRKHLEFVGDHHFERSAINQKTLEQIRTFAEQYQIEVYLTSAPLYEGLYQDEEFRRYFRQMQRSLSDFAETSDRFHIILKNPVTFNAEEMQNTDHLLAPAAETYTRRLARAIAQQATQDQATQDQRTQQP